MKPIHKVINCIICAKCHKDLSIRHKVYYVVNQNKYCRHCFKRLRIHNEMPKEEDKYDMWGHYIKFSDVTDQLLMTVPRIE